MQHPLVDILAHLLSNLRFLLLKSLIERFRKVVYRAGLAVGERSQLIILLLQRCHLKSFRLGWSGAHRIIQLRAILREVGTIVNRTLQNHIVCLNYLGKLLSLIGLAYLSLSLNVWVKCAAWASSDRIGRYRFGIFLLFVITLEIVRIVIVVILVCIDIVLARPCELALLLTSWLDPLDSIATAHGLSCRVYCSHLIAVSLWNRA